MKTTARLLLVMLLLAVLSVAACAPKMTGLVSVNNVEKKVHTLYIWDADGHTDLALLRGLKAEATRQLVAGGYIVSSDPNATAAYVKITVDDAVKDKGGFIRARLYIVDAMDQGIIYDKICEAGSGGDGYPTDRFIGCALSEFMGTGKGN